MPLRPRMALLYDGSSQSLPSTGGSRQQTGGQTVKGAFIHHPCEQHPPQPPFPSHADHEGGSSGYISLGTPRLFLRLGRGGGAWHGGGP